MENLHKLSAFNMAAGDTFFTVNFNGFEKYSIQAIWADVTGTNNGTIKVLQSLDGTNFDQLKTINSAGAEVDFGITMSGTDGSATIEDKVGFTGKTMKVVFAEGTITGGTLDIYINKIYA